MELKLLELVREILEDDALLTPPGSHDAAFVKTPDSKYLVLTCDTVNSKSDFPPEMKAVEMGIMAASVTLSDLAASGSKPLYFLSSISLKEADEKLLEEILIGIKSLCSKYGVKVAGGDLDFAEFLTITGFAIGSAERVITRGGARKGEKVYVTSPLGKAQLCLEMLGRGYRRSDLPYTSSLYTPQPRIYEGIEIARFAGAMTDVSDSLAISLHQISRESGVKIILDFDKIPLNHLKPYVGVEKSLELFLYGGGDFELLFTAGEVGRKYGIEVGAVEEGEGVYLKRDGKLEEVEMRGYVHWKD